MPYLLLLIFLLASVTAGEAASQFTSSEEVYYDEVFFDFRYRQLVNTTLVAFIKDERIYLPAGEVFSMLLIFNNFNQSSLVFDGYISSQANSFSLDLKNLSYSFRNKRGTLTQDDFIVDVFDIYLSTDLLLEVFGFEFEINMSALGIRLITEERLPIRVRQERLLARIRTQDQFGVRDFFEPVVPRRNQLINGYFLDYNLNFSTQNFQNQTGSFRLQSGAEILSGDVQFDLNVNTNPVTGITANRGNFRWRYYTPQESKWAPNQIIAGNLAGRGISLNRSVRGVSVSNEPLYPSRVFDEFTYRDTGQPDSEVEIFINDRLFDVIYIDESGLFEVRLPITFGINDIRIVKYAPDGQIVEHNQSLNIPFFFVPNRSVFYTAYIGGTLGTFSNPDDYAVGLLDLGYGLSRSNTIRAKAEIISTQGSTEAAFLGEFSQRISQFIANFSYSPQRFESVNLTYQSQGNAFINVSGINYRTGYQVLNNPIQYNYATTFFYSIRNPLLPIFYRGGYDYSKYNGFDVETITSNLSIRRSRFSLNFGLRNVSRNVGALSVQQSTYNVALGYTTPRQGIWKPLRGVLTRSQLIYLNDFDRPEQLNLSISRSIFRSGQFQVNYSHFFATGRSSVFFTFNLEFPQFRTNTTLRRASQNYIFNQNVRGSLGYFHDDRVILLDNRNQVGRAALVFDTFIDNDGDGVFGDGDQRLNYNSIRMRGAGARSTVRDGRIYITGLRQYDRYNIEINEAAITDPTLVTARNTFSVVTDPNQFKRIYVPFLRSGILQGEVARITSTGRQPTSGLNVRLMNLSDSTITTARTFFDGSFFEMGVIPGRYVAYPDSTQLQILGVRAEPAIYPFEILASEFGDFVDIAFELYPLVPVEPSPDVAPEPAPPVVAPPVAVADPEPVAPPVTGLEPSQLYRVQIAMMPTLARAMIARERVERLLNHPAEITLSNRLNMYRVLTRDIDDLQIATQMLAIVSRETEHRDAYMLNSVNYLLSDVTYAVQIGAFRNSADADRHAEQARSRFGLDVHSFYHEISGWFVVQTREFTNWREAILLRDRIRSTTSYTDAFTSAKPPEFQIFSSYSVQVGAYAREEFARTQAQAFSRRTGMRFVVEYNPAARLYAVRVVDLNDLQQAETILRRLLEDYGFEEGIILSLERASGMN
jgi:hypothetical protein